MTNIVKSKSSKVDQEGEALWYALFALRQLNAKWYMRRTGRVIPQFDVVRTHKAHKDIVQGFFVAMGQTNPEACR